MTVHRPAIAAAGVLACVIAAGSAQQQTQPPRDTSALSGAPATTASTGRLSGRVVASDTGKPIKRARVFINAAEAGGRGTLTDDNGAYDFSRSSGRPLHHQRVEERLHPAVLRPAPSAPGGHAAPAARRATAQQHRLRAAARRRPLRPRVGRERRRHARRGGASDAVSIPAGQSPARSCRPGANRRPRRVSRVGSESWRLLRERGRAQ